MRTRLLMMAPLMAAALAPASLLADTTYPAVGGPGDSQVVDQCPPGMWLVGLKGRGGLWIDQIGLICQQLSPDRSAVVGRRWHGPARGGNGGAPQEYMCPANAVVGSVWMTMTPKNRQVKVLHAYCRSLKGGGPDGEFHFNAGPAGMGGSTSPKGQGVQNCAEGEEASGFAINFGVHVNAMGLVCRRL
jgi:hypothetical protein